MLYFIFFFFFQAEDGIRDLTVTGVQTCALPIYRVRRLFELPQVLRQPGHRGRRIEDDLGAVQPEQASPFGEMAVVADVDADRSEERRVGKECRSRWSP